MHWWWIPLAVLAFVFFFYATTIICSIMVPLDKTPIEQISTEQESPQKEQEEKKDDMRLRLDPLGKFKTPGRCIGWICF